MGFFTVVIFTVVGFVAGVGTMYYYTMTKQRTEKTGAPVMVMTSDPNYRPAV